MRKLLTIFIILLASTICSANNPFASGRYVDPVKRVKLSPFATTWYVDPAGNDATGTGSAGNPWQTLYKASTTVTTSGDLIHLNAGTFTETQRSLISPGVSVEGVDTSSTILRCTVTTQFYEIIGFRSGTEGTAGDQSVSNIYLDGQNRTSSWGIVVFARSNVDIFNCKFNGFDESAIFYTGKIDFNTEDEPTTAYATGIDIYNCNIQNSSKADGTYGRGAIYMTGVEGVNIHHCVIDQSQRAAGANGYCIKLNNFTKDVEIYYCDLLRDRFPYYTEGNSNHFGFSIESGDPVALHVHHCYLTGNIDINRCNKGSYSFGALIEYNTFGHTTLSGNQECGVWLEYSNSDIDIRNNIFRNLTNGLLFSNHFDHNLNERIYFRYNLCYGSGRDGGSGDAYLTTITDGLQNNSLDSIFIVHNTFVGHPTYPNAQLVSFSNNYDGITNYFFQDNIVVAAGSDAPFISGSAAFITSLYNTNNTLYNNGNSNAAKWLTGSPVSYTITGQLTTDPLLNVDYTLQAGSPALNSASDGTNRGHTGTGSGGGGESAPGYLKKVRGKKLNFITN